MSDTRRRAGLGTVLMLALLAQTAFFPYVRLFGVVPDVMIVATVAVAVREGPETGAMFGFVAGVLVDLFLEVPVGLSALAYSIVGYAVGTAQTSILRERRWLAPMLAGSGSLGAGLIFVLVGLVLGQDHLLALRTFMILPARALYDAVLALAVFWSADRIMGPAEDFVTSRL